MRSASAVGCGPEVTPSISLDMRPITTYHLAVPADTLSNQNQPLPSGHAQRIWARWGELSVRTRNTFGKVIKGPKDVQTFLLDDLRRKHRFRYIPNAGTKSKFEMARLIEQTRMRPAALSGSLYSAQGKLVVPDVSSPAEDDISLVASAVAQFDHREQQSVQPLAHAVWSLWQDVSVRAKNTFGKVIKGPEDVQRFFLDDLNWPDKFGEVRNVGRKTIHEVDALLRKAREMDLTPWEGLSKEGEQSGMSGDSRVEEGAQLPEDGGFDVLEALHQFHGELSGLSVRARNVMANFLKDGGDPVRLMHLWDFGKTEILGVRNCGTKTARDIAS